MAFVVGQTVAFTFVIAFQCSPVISYWDTTRSGTCINSQAFVYSAAGISIFEDIVIMFLPVMELKALKLDLRKKFALGFMFALGSLCVSAQKVSLVTGSLTQIQCEYHQHDSTQVHHRIWHIP